MGILTIYNYDKSTNKLVLDFPNKRVRLYAIQKTFESLSNALGLDIIDTDQFVEPLREEKINIFLKIYITWIASITQLQDMNNTPAEIPEGVYYLSMATLFAKIQDMNIDKFLKRQDKG